MSQLTLDEVKRFCQAEHFADDDALLLDLKAAAEAYVKDYTRRDLDEEFPVAWPVPCLMAAKFLVATWYEDREAGVPQGVRDMLARYRDMS